MAGRATRQLDLPVPPTWGGTRAGAGRKPAAERPGVAHLRRPDHDGRHPVHVTVRVRRDVPNLRSDRIFPALCSALGRSSRGRFRVVHFSVQTDHLHLVVEAETSDALVRGIQGLSVRCARAINRRAGRRGAVWSGRYHARALATPREVRAGLAYVLLNFRKHLRAPATVDPRSSGPWFDGWSRPVPEPREPCPTAGPRTWLGICGWRRAGGAIDVREMPGRRRVRPHL